MSSSENKTPCCPICFMSYDCQRVIPIVYSCGHGICIKCDGNPNNKMENCHTCRQSITSRARNFVLIEFLEVFKKQRNGTKSSRDNFSLLLPMIESKIGKFKDSCESLDKIFSDFKNILNIILKNYEELTKMAYRRRNRERRDDILNKRDEFIMEVTSIFVEAENELEKYTCSIQRTSTSSGWIMDKLKNTCDLLDQRVLLVKQRWDDTIKKCDEFTEMVENSETKENQNEIFEKMEKFVDEMEIFNGFVQFGLKVNRSNLKISLHRINEWCKAERGRQV